MDDYYIFCTFFIVVGLGVSAVLMWSKLHAISKSQDLSETDMFQYHKGIMELINEIDKRVLVTETRLAERGQVHESEYWGYEIAPMPIKRKRGRPPKAIGEIKNPPRGTEGQE